MKRFLYNVIQALRISRRAFSVCMSTLFLVAVLIPGCMKNQKNALDGGRLIRNSYETYWEAQYFPLPVFIDRNMPDHLIVGMYDAINTWNINTGVHVFTPVPVDLLEELPKGCGWVAAIEKDIPTSGLWRAVEKPGTSSLCAGEVSLDVGIIQGTSAKLWAHELGHALGLAHDHGDKRSIMYPIVFSDYPQYLMPDDLASVRNMVNGYFQPLPASVRLEINKFLSHL